MNGGRAASALTPLLAALPALAGAAAFALTLRFGSWPAPGDVPALDLIAHRAPAEYHVLRVWYWLAPAAATLTLTASLHALARELLAPGWPAFRATLQRRATWLLARLRQSLTLRILLSAAAALFAIIWAARARPFPSPGQNQILDLVASHDPAVFSLFRAWHFFTPGLLAFGAALFFSGARRLWLESRPEPGRHGRGALPPWPTSPEDDELSLVLGEVHHPLEAKEVPQPEWLTIPERGLYTGVAIFGAVGTGKTSGCMRPFADQLFGWQASDPRRRAAGLVLEVKGDFCHDIHELLADHGRESDYVEIGLGGRWQWNPLDSVMDSYSLAYSIASLLNQLFGKSKEPFWQQASTNLIRWIIELHRAFPSGWVTLQDLYRLTIDPEAFAAKIEAAKAIGPQDTPALLEVSDDHWDHPDLAQLDWQRGRPGRMTFPSTPDLIDRLGELSIPLTALPARPAPADDRALRLAAVERWYAKDWMALDLKLRTSIVEGISVFLSAFDLPDVSRLFCPPAPAKRTPPSSPEPGSSPDSVTADLLTPLPSMTELIESGKVVALNMPAGASPALARVIGVLLKGAWLQSLLRRPEQMKKHPQTFFRPAVFVCDEYQAFATVGQDDPAGDEKAFGMTRQSRCIPIVATQSIASLRSVLPGDAAWRTLIQNLRTRIFLALSDDSSADTASNMCGKVARLSPSFSFSESSKPAFSLVTARAGGGQGGSIGATKNYREQREPMFHPRAFSLLKNYQAIALAYDGRQSLPASRLYLKPHYLPRDRPYWRARDKGEL